MTPKQTQYKCPKCGSLTGYLRNIGFICPTHGGVN
jgi:predicted RNA-binding Zn-ribbon protein involved in translation (DUF1610 family)